MNHLNIINIKYNAHIYCIVNHHYHVFHVPWWFHSVNKSFHVPRWFHSVNKSCSTIFQLHMIPITLALYIE